MKRFDEVLDAYYGAPAPRPALLPVLDLLHDEVRRREISGEIIDDDWKASAEHWKA